MSIAEYLKIGIKGATYLYLSSLALTFSSALVTGLKNGFERGKKAKKEGKSLPAVLKQNPAEQNESVTSYELTADEKQRLDQLMEFINSEKIQRRLFPMVVKIELIPGNGLLFSEHYPMSVRVNSDFSCPITMHRKFLSNEFTYEQLQALVAHEISHIVRLDVLSLPSESLLDTLSLTNILAMSWLSQYLLEAVIKGEASGKDLTKMAFLSAILAISTVVAAKTSCTFHTIEYEADASSIKLTGKPDDLCSAIRALREVSQKEVIQTNGPILGAARLAYASFNNCFTFFSTHPSDSKRIARIEVEKKASLQMA